MQKFSTLSKDREDCKEIYDYLIEFYRKYDVIVMRRGYVDFYTVQNKEQLIKNQDFDATIMRKISPIYFEDRLEKIKNNNPKWETDMHGDVTRIPAEEMIMAKNDMPTFTESQLNILEPYAPEPDNATLPQIPGRIITHYSGFVSIGGLQFYWPGACEKAQSYTNLSLNKTDPFRNLGEGTHYVGDLMNPFHVDGAVTQLIDYGWQWAYIHLVGSVRKITGAEEVKEFSFTGSHELYEWYVYSNWNSYFKNKYVNFTGSYDVETPKDAAYGIRGYTVQYFPSLNPGQGPWKDISEQELVASGYDFDNNGSIELADVLIFLRRV